MLKSVRALRISRFKLLKARFSTEDDNSISYDVSIVGGGIAGLSSAIRLKQLSVEKNIDLSVCVLEKGSEIGAHILSGNCFEISALEKLFPDWRSMDNPPPLQQKVRSESLRYFISNNYSVEIPHIFLPSDVHNKDNYIISLGQFCKWLADQAENLGVDIFPGFSVDKPLYENNKLTGVQTKEMGISKDNSRKETYQPGFKILSKLTILAEGARGNITESVAQKYNLRANSDPQTYGLGIKELWEVPGLKAGHILHTVGWPSPSDVYGGGFLYTTENQVHLGYITGLDYQNPFVNPYEELQKWKTHKEVRSIIENGRCINYGARVINEGGYYAIPKLSFPGGILVGCSAGFVNVMKIKGAHNALRSGVYAAETIMEDLETKGERVFDDAFDNYDKKIKNSDIVSELWRSRNFKAGFEKGRIFGLINGAICGLLKGHEPYSLRIHKQDSQTTERAYKFKQIDYPKHDGKLTFDLLDNIARSGTYHDHDQPSHLKIKPGLEKQSKISLKEYAGFEGGFNREILSSKSV